MNAYLIIFSGLIYIYMIKMLLNFVLVQILSDSLNLRCLKKANNLKITTHKVSLLPWKPGYH